MAMKLTIIGCTGSMSGPKSAASSYLLQSEGTDVHGGPRTWSVVFDLGPGSFGELWNYVRPEQVDAFVFTHGHADHMGDVVSLYVYNRWYPGGQLPVQDVYGPSNTRERVRQIDGWATDEELDGVLAFHTVQAEVPFHVGPMTITPFTARHTVEAFGYRVDAAGKSVALTGDTDSCDSITRMADRVDLLLAEAAFTSADTVRGIHMDGNRAGLLAGEAQVGSLVLTHLQPWTDPELVKKEARTSWHGPLDLAETGKVFHV